MEHWTTPTSLKTMKTEDQCEIRWNLKFNKAEQEAQTKPLKASLATHKTT